MFDREELTWGFGWHQSQSQLLYRAHYQAEKEGWKQSGGWNGGGDLRKRLGHTREPGIETDGNAGGDGPGSRKEQNQIDADRREGGLLQSGSPAILNGRPRAGSLRRLSAQSALP